MEPSLYLFDFYNLFVNQIFGSVLLSIFAVGLLILLIMLICRSSLIFIIYWLAFYFIVMTTLYLGALGIVIGTLLAFVYFGISLIRLLVRKE